jgi:hypothetical protein
MKLSQLCLILGLGYALPNIYGFLNPKTFGETLRKFPRNIPMGFLLMLAATGWFEWILWNERLGDIAPWKPMLQAVFLFAGVAACFVLQDFLAVRGLSVLMMLTANVMLDVQRLYPSPLKNIVTVWAYVIAVCGMWFVVSPWRLRDWILWNTASEGRLKQATAIRALFGIGIAILGLTVLK